MSNKEKIIICCDGEAKSAHPKIFITFKRKTEIVRCQYCGKSFSREKIEVKKTN